MVMILIPEPNSYYSEADEVAFFKWLKLLPAFEKVIRVPEGVELYLTKMDKITLYELIGVFFRYKLDKKCLKILCEKHRDKRFRNPETYWYKEIFGAQ